MFGGIFCINLRKRSDRWAQVSSDLGQFNLERVEAVTEEEISGPSRECFPTERACTESHQKTLDLFLRRGGSLPALVFEDDAYPLVMFPEKVIGNILKEAPENWKILLLGYGPKVSVKRTSDFLGIVDGSDGSHAYLISRLGAARLASLIDPAGKPFDVQLKSIFGKSLLGVSEPIFSQRDGFSDIQNKERRVYNSGFSK